MTGDEGLKTCDQRCGNQVVIHEILHAIHRKRPPKCRFQGRLGGHRIAAQRAYLVITANHFQGNVILMSPLVVDLQFMLNSSRGINGECQFGLGTASGIGRATTKLQDGLERVRTRRRSRQSFRDQAAGGDQVGPFFKSAKRDQRIQIGGIFNTQHHLQRRFQEFWRLTPVSSRDNPDNIQKCSTIICQEQPQSDRRKASGILDFQRNSFGRNGTSLPVDKTSFGREPHRLGESPSVRIRNVVEGIAKCLPPCDDLCCG